MALMNTRTKNRPDKTNVMDRALKRSTVQTTVPFITQDTVPAGKYVTRITSVSDSKTTAGKDAIDITYELVDSSGKAVVAKERHPADGYLFQKLVDHWIDCQLIPDGANPSDLVGIEEEAEVTYVYEGALGNLQNRRPVNQASKATSPKKTSAPPVKDADKDDLEEDMEEDLDDEFDDFLDETDDI